MSRKLPNHETIEPGRYELRGESPHRLQIEMDRREFIQVVGAGILISVAPEMAFGQRSRSRGRDAGSISERLHIGADGVITVMTGKVEVGQGSRTQITMAAAEELGVGVDAIRLVMADSSVCPDDGGTAGSRTTPSTVPRVRRACAAARNLLLDTAARLWNVNRESLSARAGKVFGDTSERVISYSDLVRQQFEEGIDGEIKPGITVAAVADWKVLGTPVPKVGGLNVVTGTHRYPSDILLPGLLYGKVLRPPAYGATLESVDLAPAKAMPGVTAVRDGDFVGFAAATTFKADQAMRAVAASAKWKRTSQPSSDELYAYLKQNALPVGSGGRGRRQRKRTVGSTEEGFEAAKKTLRESYHIAYVQHAPMEPRAAVADWKPEGLTIWTGTQQPARVHGQVAEASQLPREKVRIIVPDTGGGFGGKHSGEAAVEAARLSRAAGRPVSLRWTREEEFTWAYFRPAGVIDVAAGLDAADSIIAWDHINYNSGSSAIATPYAIPNTQTQSRSCEAPLRPGSYRALASTANVFARESFMDELAAAIGADPLEFRLQHLHNNNEQRARLRAVLESAAKRFDWARRKKELGDSNVRGIGLACGTEKGSYVAACVELEVDRENGRFKVLEVCEAFECGAIQNPLNLRAQVEGCIMQGLGGALREEIRFSDGRIENPRFSRYRVPRFSDVPKIETVLLDRRDLRSAGAGETPIVAVAPAIGNALFAATGVRIRSLPIRNDTYRSV